jgi:hypothetical protein
MIMSKNKPAAIMTLTMVSLVAFGGPSMAQTPAPVNPAQEEAFLDILPKVTVPDDVRPIEGAVNTEWRQCKGEWPSEYRLSQAGPEARAYRDIYGFVQAKSVIETQDCGCVTKAASWSDVEAIANKLRPVYGVDQLGWKHTRALSDTSDRLITVAETMCGGPF